MRERPERILTLNLENQNFLSRFIPLAKFQFLEAGNWFIMCIHYMPCMIRAAFVHDPIDDRPQASEKSEPGLKGDQTLQRLFLLDTPVLQLG